MKKLTSLFATLVALTLMTGPAMADMMAGGEESNVSMAGNLNTLGKELRKHLSPNISGYIADGVGEEAFNAPVDTHYGVGPAWAGTAEEPLTKVEELGKELRKHLSPNIAGYIADGVREVEFREPIDTHYGVSPTWGRVDSPFGKELRKHLSPNAIKNEFISD